MRLPSIKSLFTKASVTLKRFPMAIAAAITGTGYGMLLIHLPYNLAESHAYYNNIIMASYLGMLVFIALDIYILRKGYNDKIRTGTYVTATALLLAYYLSLPGQFMAISFTRFLLFALSLHLLIAFAPFTGRNEINGFWQYNKTLFLRLLTSCLYTVVLFLGLALAMAAIEKLFNVPISSNTYGDLWILLCGIFNTWFFLAGFPVNFKELETKRDYPKGLKIFTQYVLLPLIAIYLVILYAYMGKIIVTSQWPAGWVAYLVIGCSVSGVLSLLLIFPIRNDENNKWILLFSRFFYFALFPLIILLVLGVQRRIHEYGITELRYFVLTLAIWLLFIAVYFLISKAKNIKVIPVSLCLLSVASSFGPWGAFRVSLASQKYRFETLLEKYSMLDKGKVVPARDTIPFRDHKQLSSIVHYLVSVHGYPSLQSFFSQNLTEPVKKDEDRYSFYYRKVNQVHTLMHLDYIPDYQMAPEEAAATFSSFSRNEEGISSLLGYDYLISDFQVEDYPLNDTACHTFPTGINPISVCFDRKKYILQIALGTAGAVESIDLNPFFARLYQNDQDAGTLPDSMMTLLDGSASFKTKIIFNSVHFKKLNGKVSEPGFTADIFLKTP